VLVFCVQREDVDAVRPDHIDPDYGQAPGGLGCGVEVLALGACMDLRGIEMVRRRELPRRPG
jgi:DNA-binding sugar fermentation-stimulating protein